MDVRKKSLEFLIAYDDNLDTTFTIKQFLVFRFFEVASDFFLLPLGFGLGLGLGF